MLKMAAPSHSVMSKFTMFIFYSSTKFTFLWPSVTTHEHAYAAKILVISVTTNENSCANIQC